VNPSGGGSHTAFARRSLEAAAVGAGLTYDQVSGDLTQANYSSLRAGKIEFRRLCEQVQYGMLIPMLVRPIAERFHVQGTLLGLWGDAMPKGVAHVPPAHEMIDPLKDTPALIAQVRAGFVPQPEAAGAFGYDFRSAVEMIREANAALDAKIDICGDERINALKWQLVAVTQERDMWKETDIRDAARVDELAKQLTASQYYAQQLWDALNECLTNIASGRFDQDMVQAALNLPRNTSALDELRKDAGRYRWLTTNQDADRLVDIAIRDGEHWSCIYGSKETINATIDDAIHRPQWWQ
jgi:hypothetical protein